MLPLTFFRSLVPPFKKPPETEKVVLKAAFNPQESRILLSKQPLELVIFF
jgi:hypothetical protein